MPSSDYKNAVGGGLKLKGAKDAGVKKLKKKKDKGSSKNREDASDTLVNDTNPKIQEDETEEGSPVDENTNDTTTTIARTETEDTLEKLPSRVPSELPRAAGKTEAQRRHEETRRRRLDEKLQKEGVKTHKQRVEELNRYLSRLSEHHDMPKIGPG